MKWVIKPSKSSWRGAMKHRLIGDDSILVGSRFLITTSTEPIDFLFLANTWLVSTEPAKPLVKSAPYTFQCLKNNANPPKGAPPYFVKWAYCSNAGVIEPKLCSTEDLLSLIKSNNWPAHIRSNGDLYVPYFSNSVANQLQVSNQLFHFGVNYM